ncbi:hypothetical protein [Marinomonas posidonica]|uniref:Uncharacterized protein n=1 Tax=Marinomonas posidonica (strain CECT 7376 / NCIMB 14433 / IVIA-Po-181) TaxID=491952 RepID=F6CVC4_MARPP|nr:hypothetical protein [Marinomonas posidonica]AEF54234.1 hypothetical protein Mar181_1187 [Marinomonas posidonica IVIA-Po-181]
MHKSHAQMMTGLILSALYQPALADPIKAVIGLQNSQVVEDNKELTLSPVAGSVLPFATDFRPIEYLGDASQRQWINQVGSKIRVEHKHRDLNYTGLLTQVNQAQQNFTLSLNNRPVTLPMNDFYLVPLESHAKQAQNIDNLPISYQTEQLSWTPQLNLIFNDNKVTLTQQALLTNQSNQALMLESSLLHYSHHQPSPKFKNERASMMLDSAAPQVSYQDNEVVFPLADQIALAPYSNTLYALPSDTLNIQNQRHTAEQFTHSGQAGSLPLSFYNQLTFTLKQDSMPGSYKTFWQKGPLLIPANQVNLNQMRSGQTLDVITNKSQAISGHLTLLNASSKQLPSRQVWQLSVKNHDKKMAKFALQQNTNGIVDIIKANQVTKNSANALLIEGQLAPQQEKIITYTIEVKK